MLIGDISGCAFCGLLFLGHVFQAPLWKLEKASPFFSLADLQSSTFGWFLCVNFRRRSKKSCVLQTNSVNYKMRFLIRSQERYFAASPSAFAALLRLHFVIPSRKSVKSYY